MHEVGVMEAALQQAVLAAEQAGASRIERVTFAIISGAHVTAESVETLFAVLSRGTLAEGAALAVETRPGRAYCPRCDAAFVVPAEPSSDLAPVCPACGTSGLPEMGTPELALVSIDIPD
jgi:hydrogenase nickel incorporation protein HypA/HybF